MNLVPQLSSALRNVAVRLMAMLLSQRLSMAALAMPIFAAYAHAAGLLDTSQTTCYDGSAMAKCCASSSPTA